MKFRKVLAAVAAAAVAVSMTAINAFAAVTLDSEYPGGWGASKGIPKAEFEAIGGDVKVVLTVETKDPLVGTHNHLAKPMNMCVSWDAITDGLTSDTAIRKGDGFLVFAEGQTTVEFVVPESVWSEFKGYVDAEGNEDESAGLYFQVNDVIIKSAELSAGSPQGAMKVVDEAQASDIMDGKSYEEATGAAPAADAAPADEAPVADEASATVEAPVETTNDAPAAPVADTAATTSAATGNVPAAVMVSVMAVAGAAVIAAKKRK
ncbi:MAG: hypothetical protein K2N26_09825 [Oscillospiraceae bacterium]|nr:hypothetical protein [Oscillospiraceae bacterium]